MLSQSIRHRIHSAAMTAAAFGLAVTGIAGQAIYDAKAPPIN
jgi:hypothetical protein